MSFHIFNRTWTIFPLLDQQDYSWQNLQSYILFLPVPNIWGGHQITLQFFVSKFTTLPSSRDLGNNPTLRYAGCLHEWWWTRKLFSFGYMEILKWSKMEFWEIIQICWCFTFGEVVWPITWLLIYYVDLQKYVPGWDVGRSRYSDFELCFENT